MAYLQVKQLGEVRVVQSAFSVTKELSDYRSGEYIFLHKFIGIDEEPSYGFALRIDDIITVEISEDEVLDEDYDKIFKYKKE